MKYLFRVTENKIETLLRGVDFETNGKIIVFAEDGKNIRMEDLNVVLINYKYGYVAFTDEEKNCKTLQLKIKGGYK